MGEEARDYVCPIPPYIIHSINGRQRQYHTKQDRKSPYPHGPSILIVSSVPRTVAENSRSLAE